eukprot:TRINITY_DN36583_c0_g1_i1.p1 TRINITY_DN36583_c0_g1~~TRINITY_DN36583_c0_g1_i1.p1  ORF type:complete len:411 (-),score=65.46 TRINITY_DN36583_c0_g1_i1:45-1277(-)
MWTLFDSKSSSWNPIERLLYPAPQASYSLQSFPDELILIPRGDGQRIPCLFLPFRHSRFLMIYFHANAEDLGICHQFCSTLRELFQVHVLAVEYPGYGICTGKSCEANILQNARAAMDFVTKTLNWPFDGIKIFGRSLGTGPTIALAAEYEVAGVILVSPFTSVRECFRSHLGALADFVDDRFQNADLATRIMSPTLIVHGQKDTLVPLEHGKQIYELVPSRKLLVYPATMDHNTSLLTNAGSFVLPMTSFFSLPDYTFEDIQMPDWVYPRHYVSTPIMQVLAGPKLMPSSPLVPPTLSPNGAEGDARHSQRSSPRQQKCDGGEAVALTVSRHYEFRSPTTSPRGTNTEPQSHFVQAVTGIDVPAGEDGPLSPRHEPGEGPFAREETLGARTPDADLGCAVRPALFSRSL